jgi:hypothetical protein
MAVLACLGSANWWTTVPFAGLMAALLVFGLIWPSQLPDLPRGR